MSWHGTRASLPPRCSKNLKCLKCRGHNHRGARHFQTSHFPKNRLCVVQKQRQCASQPALANVHGGAPQVTALQCTAGGVVKRFYQAFNARDVEAMVDCVADDIEHNNLAYAKVFRGKQAAKAFYAAFVKIMPENASFFIEDTTGASPVTDGGSKVAVLWQLRIGGAAIPNSSGVSFYHINSNSRICYIREAPEHFLKLTSVALPTLSVLSPLLSAAQPFIENLPPEATAQPLTLLKGISQGVRHSLSSWLRPENTLKSPGKPEPKVATPPEPPSLTGAAKRALSSVRATKDAAQSKTGPSMALVSTRKLRTTALRSQSPVDTAITDSTTLSSAAATTEGTITMRTVGDVDTSTTSGSKAESPSVPDRVRYAGTLAGTWHKIKDRSDVAAYGRALELMGIGGLQKTTAMLIDGMETHHTEAIFEVFYLTIVPYFKVRESYKFDVEVKQGRRDLRKGEQTAIARQRGPVVEVDVTWGPSNPGAAHEKYWLDTEGLLHVESTVTVGSKHEMTLQVYEQTESSNLDKRYFAKGKKLPFGVDPGKLPEDLTW